MSINYNRLALEFLQNCIGNERYEEANRLGTGCERVVYRLTNTLILKIRKDIFIDKSIEPDYYDDRYDFSDCSQTENEVELWEKMSEEEKQLFNPILAHGEFNGSPYTICPYVRIGEHNYESAVQLAKSQKKEYDFNLLLKTSEKFKLDFYDMVENVYNFGIDLNGRVVITDFGMEEM